MDTFLHDLSWVPPLRSEPLTLIFNAFTYLGYPQFFLVFLPIGYWLCDKAMFTRLAMLIGIVGLSNAFLKDLFQDPRPPAAFALDPRVGDSFGLPSGHAQIATAMWLWLAYEIHRRWAWIAAIVIAVGVSASRIYLGVHDIEDVLAGVLLGLATVVIYRGFVSDVAKPWHDLHPAFQIAAIGALAPALYLLWPRDEVYVSVLGLVTFMATWWLGYLVERELVKHERHRNWLIAVPAAVVGVAALLWLFGLLGNQLKAVGLSPSVALAVQFAFMSAFATVVVPTVFRLLRLAR
jgi:membrane-associated phospholipid phosphatase